VLRFAGAAEKGSEHPLAEAILNKAENSQVKIPNVEEFEALPGRGVQCSVGNKRVLLGNRKLMQEQNVSVNELENDVSLLESQGKTVMILAVDGVTVGLIAAMDTPKENARQSIEQLKGMNLEVAMLTGDNERTAKAIAEQLGNTRQPTFYPGKRLIQSKSCSVKARLLQWLGTE
jgi:Cu+-exporting ATPase